MFLLRKSDVMLTHSDVARFTRSDVMFAKKHLPKANIITQ